MRPFVFSSLISLVLGIVLLGAQISYDIVLLPPLYNGVYANKMINNGTCLVPNTTYLFAGTFDFLSHICALRYNIDINILNCYGSNTEFLHHFRLFRWTSYVLYIQMGLVGILWLVIIYIALVHKYHQRKPYFVSLTGIWLLGYFASKIVTVITFVLYTIFRAQLAHSSGDSLPPILSGYLLTTSITFMVLSAYDFIGTIIAFREMARDDAYQRF